MESKIIGLDDANRMLPLLRQIVEDIMAHWDQIIQKRAKLECLEKGGDPRPGAPVTPKDPDAVKGLKSELNLLIDKINNYIREVEELGCFVEEFKRGIVNFPSLYNGRKVFLCWQPEEAQVRYWHELDETYNDRVEIRNAREFMVPKTEAR